VVAGVRLPDSALAHKAVDLAFRRLSLKLLDALNRA
jgi:hypothetical protein